MRQGPLTYVAITPVRDEAENLLRLSLCLAGQSLQPLRWIVVENGSGDATPVVAAQLADEHDWVRLEVAPAEAGLARGAPIVRAFHRGLKALDAEADVIVKLDADVSFDADYFELLLAEFAGDPALGLASGTCYERRQDGVWRQQRQAPGTVWGAVRAYRRTCLDQLLPLEERMGWDGVDQFKANMGGWHTRTFEEIPFRHHRPEGEREGSRVRAWAADGDIAYFMNYRLWFLAARAFHHALRRPAALAMLWGYAAAAVRREARCSDAALLEYIRRQQNLRSLPARAREALRVRRDLQNA